MAVVGVKSTIAQNVPMYTVGPYMDSVWTIDTTDFSRVSGVALTHPGLTITGSNGLALHKCSGKYYGVFKTSELTGRVLGTINLTTGVIDTIGNTGENIASISFLNDSTLMGISGNGGNSSEALYYIDMNTGALGAPIATGGAGSDGESMAVCSDNGKVYRWSGRDTDPAMEEWDMSDTTMTTVSLSGFNYDEVMGATYLGGGNFMLAELDQRYVIIDTTGFAIDSGLVYQYQKGLAFPNRYTWNDIDSVTVDTICSSEFASLHSLPGLSYQWYVDGVMISGATSPDYMANATGTYNCAVEIMGDNGSTCTDTAGVGTRIFAIPAPVVSFVNGSTDSYCLGDSVLLEANLGDSVSWSYNSVMVAGYTDTTYMATAPGTYAMTLIDGITGCAATDSVVVSEILNVSAFTFTSPIDLYISGDVIFTNTSTGSTTDAWDFGDGNTSSASSPTNTYSAVGDYVICLTAGGNACPDSTFCDTLTVETSSGIEGMENGFNLSQNVPNPFNDNTTISYEVKTSGNVTLKVYDALGKQVVVLFSGFANAGEHNVSWNATDAHGKKVDSGVYIYQIEVNGTVMSKSMMLVK